MLKKMKANRGRPELFVVNSRDFRSKNRQGSGHRAQAADWVPGNVLATEPQDSDGHSRYLLASLALLPWRFSYTFMLADAGTGDRHNSLLPSLLLMSGRSDQCPALGCRDTTLV